MSGIRVRLGAMNWEALSTAEPDLAETVEQRFGVFTHHVLATLRKDGSPRTSGIEARFLNGELWLGMMPDSLKVLDLRRDPRFALQANPGPARTWAVATYGSAGGRWRSATTSRRRPRT